MKQIEMTRLNSLFEKMVANRANVKEQKELTELYQTFINEGRDEITNVTPFATHKRVG